MERAKTRVFVYPKDLTHLTGRGVRYCQKLISQVRKFANKEKNQPVTKFEVGAYLRLNKEVMDSWIIE